VDQRGASLARTARQEVGLFRLAGTRSQRELISGLGSRAAIAIGVMFVLLDIAPSRTQHQAALLAGAGLFALTVGIFLLRMPVAAPLPVLDGLLVFADALLVLVGHYQSPIHSALPGIYVIVGTIVFSVRPWRVVLGHAALFGASYAGVLLVGPHQFAPVTRWIAVMTAIATSGLFIRWLVSTVAGLAFAEHSARELAEAAAWDLERVSKAKSEFLARMSHELRTPLNVVLGFSDLLGEQLVGPLNARQEEYAADISASARHLVALVGDVLDVAKIESGEVGLDTAPLNIRRALEDGLTMVRERAATNSVSLILDVSRGLGSVEADGLKIRQVVVNLLANAVKFTPEGGRIMVSARAVGDCVRVSVQDTGVGIAVEDRDRIFEQFAQTASTSEGTGLGLPLARQFVELHGGRLWVDSKPGAGSTFSFEIPRRQSQVTPSASDADETVEAGPDYSAFTEPASTANRVLLARIGTWLILTAGALVTVFGAITPIDTSTRIVLIIGGVAGMALSAIARHYEARPLRKVEYTMWIGIAAASVVTYYGGPFDALVPLTYTWATMVSFALWPRSRALTHLAGAAVAYGIVLVLTRPPDAVGRWIATMIVITFNGEVVSWVTDQLRRLVVSEQAAHRAAERARAKLEATGHHKGGFVANMSHELRAPLNAIIGFADLLQTEAVGTLNERQHEYLADIQVAARHLLAIINDVLDVAKLDAGQMRISQDVVAVQALLEHAIVLANQPESDRMVRIHLEVDPGVEFIVADHHRLEQVLVNLISNAIKFTPDGGRVAISAAGTPAGELQISVSDTGVGIVPSQRKRIFEPFHQGAPRPGDNLQEGTGLGLALVKGLVELHGGTVTVSSEPGQGSTFTVALPRLVAPTQNLEPMLRAQP
jgi:signal transduction histidine kinase